MKSRAEGSRRVRRRFLIALGTMVVGFFAVARSGAIENSTHIHWHEVSATYNLAADLPQNWKDAIGSAATTWGTTTLIKFNRGVDGVTPDPSTSDHLIWAGDIPGLWQSSCPPAFTLACARWKFQESTGHLSDADFIFNSAAFAFGTDPLNTCTNGPAGLSHVYDLETVALHELGHWGVLYHTIDPTAVMFPFYKGCQRASTPHDVLSMDSNYATHGGIGGFQIEASLEQLTAASDIVVRGVVLSDEIRAFSQDSALSGLFRPEALELAGSYRDVKIVVFEYLKGTGPAAISVRRLNLPPGFEAEDQAEPFIEEEQILFLFEGTGVWSGGYLVLGEQGIARVTGYAAVSATGMTFSIDQLRSQARDHR